MKTLRVMMLMAALAALFAAVMMVSAAGRTTPGTPTTGEEQFDAAATYRAKCIACHGPKGEKKFDAAKADAHHVEVVLKGKKMEKPPHMPGYEEKGITSDQANALIVYMRSINQ